MDFLKLTPEQIDMLHREGYSPLENIDEYNLQKGDLIRIMYNNSIVSKSLKITKKHLEKGELTTLVGVTRAQDGKKEVNILENSIYYYRPIGWKLIARWNIFSQQYEWRK